MGHSNWYICVWDESTMQVIYEGWHDRYLTLKLQLFVITVNSLNKSLVQFDNYTLLFLKLILIADFEKFNFFDK